MKKSYVLWIAGLLLFAPLCFGQNATMYFNGGYQGSNWTYGNETVGTGFYDGSINGVAVGPGQPGGLGMICDDFRDNIYSGETWTANAVNASTLTSSNLGQTLFGTSIGLTGYQQVLTSYTRCFPPIRTRLPRLHILRLFGPSPVAGLIRPSSPGWHSLCTTT